MDERRQLLSRFKLEIPIYRVERVENYYGDMIEVYDDIDYYVNNLDNIYDKISLAQWANNFKKVEELIKELNLSEEQQELYLKLKDKNIDINETINFEILSPKYSFLGNMLDMITTDRLIQEQILSLSDEMLELFKILYNRLESLSDYNVPYITKILRKIGYVTPESHWMNNFHYYDELNKELETLIKEGYQFTEKEIDTLLFLYNNNIQFAVRNMEEVINFGQEGTQVQIDMVDIIEQQRTNEKKDIVKIKIALLLKTYGVGFNEAQEILQKYDLTKLELTEENKDLFEMYKAILQIVNESNPDILISIYDAFSKQMNPHFDFMRTTTFENNLRKEFAKSLNREVFKTDNRPYTLIDGIQVYDAGLDFKMIVTAIGAYQSDFKDQDNYSKYWNSSTIRSHGNCCSLIGNNNLSMAKVKNIILGFSTMNDNMLLLSGDKDLNSTPDSRKFNTTENSRCNIFTSGDELLDSTRGDYNELVYERRDLSSNPKFYKKNPDYIVFIEEYEDIDKYIELYSNKKWGRISNYTLEYLLKQKQEQEHLWQETLKAAKDFDIPIVRINREKCAKNEIQKIDDMVTEFEQTKNPEIISKIITQFHNNRFGNKNYHDLIISAYFSIPIMTKYLERIDNTIIAIEDEPTRSNILKTYKTVIETEQKKVDYYRYIANTKQLSAIDFVETLQKIDMMQQFTSYGNVSNNSQKKGK